MHVLTGIIVKKEEGWDRDDVRGVAEEFLDEFQDSVWDWRTSDAGRWSTRFPDNVIPATSKQFFDIVEELVEDQIANYNYLKKDIEELNVSNLMANYENASAFGCKFALATNESELIKTSPEDRLKAFSLQRILDTMLGYFNSDSHIYDIERETAHITKNLIENYRSKPDKYCIVLFDIHV